MTRVSRFNPITALVADRGLQLAIHKQGHGGLILTANRVAMNVIIVSNGFRQWRGFKSVEVIDDAIEELVHCMLLDCFVLMLP